MTQNLTGAILWIAETLRDTSDIRNVYDYPPDQISVYPSIIIYPSSGTISFGPSLVGKWLNNITIEIHLCRRDSIKDIKRMLPFFHSVPKKLLQNPTLGDTVSTFEQIKYRFGAMNWGGVDTIGIEFMLENVKIQEALDA